MSLAIHHIDMLHVQDDWNWLLRDEENDLTLVVDPSEAKGVMAFLDAKGWGLDAILNTHHHWDHTNGNLKLKARFGCQIVGAARDAARIPGIDVKLEDGEAYYFGEHRFDSLDVSGHTIGHIAFYCAKAIPSSVYGGGLGWGHSENADSPHLTSPRGRGEELNGILFTGDTLFAMGCGRMFEGDAKMYHSSLQKIAALPEETIIYPQHEYTIPNGRFARSVEPENQAISEHIEHAKQLRRQKLPSLPTTLKRELESNPFLRTHSEEIRETLGMQNAEDYEVFGELRRRKDAA